MGEKYEEIPIDPDEATDLPLHARNCMRRYVALVKLINDGNRRRAKQEIVTWIYRGLVLPALLAILVTLWKMPSLAALGH
jgi:hypothetical protein